MRPFVENFPFFCIFLALVAGILSATFRSGRAAYRMTLAVTGAIAVLSALTLRYVVEGGLSFSYTMGRFPIPLGNAAAPSRPCCAPCSRGCCSLPWWAGPGTCFTTCCRRSSGSISSWST